jgi:hypothetical protein
MGEPLKLVMTPEHFMSQSSAVIRIDNATYLKLHDYSLMHNGRDNRRRRNVRAPPAYSNLKQKYFPSGSLSG